jgi:hypothetical protein
MMGGIGKAFGRLLGVKKPKVPAVVAPPRLEDTKKTAVDEESRAALANQQERRNITAQADRGLLGTGLNENTQDSLLGNIQETQAGLATRDTRVQTDVERIAAAKKRREQAAAAAATPVRHQARKR